MNGISDYAGLKDPHTSLLFMKLSNYIKTDRVILLLTGLIYFITAKGYIEILDTNYSLLTAEAILRKGTTALDIPFAEMFTFIGSDGHIYSKYGVGLPLYYLPWVATAQLLSDFSGLPEREISGFLISFSNIPVALLSLHLFKKLLQLFNVAPKSISLLIAGLGLGTIFWRYGVYDFSEEIQLLLILSSFYGVIKNTPSSHILAGTGFSCLLLLKLVYFAFLPFFILYLLIRLKKQDEKRYYPLIRFIIPVLISIGAILILNQMRFGNPFESGYGNESGRFALSQLVHTIPALLWSFDKGLFVYCPLLLLSIPGWRYFFRQHWPEATLCLSMILINLILSAAWWSWTGGWCYGPRLLVPMIPLYLFPICFWLMNDISERRFKLTAVLVIISFLVQIPGILVKDQEIHHLKELSLTKEEKLYAPSDLKMTIIVMLHKFKYGNEIYNAGEFGIPGNRELSLTQYKTYRSYNIWGNQLALHLNKPLIRFVPFVLCFGAALCLMLGYLMKKIWQNYRLSNKNR